MDSKRLIICDPESGYAEALGLFLSQKKELSLQVQVYTSLEKIKEVPEEEADCLLLSEEFPEEERKAVGAGTVCLLTQNPGRVPRDGERVLYKYQPGEKLLETLLSLWETDGSGAKIFRQPSGKKKGRVIGIFSPVHRVGKTSYALRLGEELAASENVLYLNLEVYAGAGGHFEEGAHTMEDVIYYARQEKGNLGLVLTTAVRHKNGLDYVLPMSMPEDVKSIPAKEWRDLTIRILQESLYETVILDIDEAISGVYTLLEICEQIHMIEAEDSYSQAKIRQFQEEAELLGREDILEKIVYKKGRS